MNQSKRTLPALALVVGMIAALTMVPLGSSTHGDGAMDQPVWFQWTTRYIDILVIPPERGQLLNGNLLLNGGSPAELNPCTMSYTLAIDETINDWKQAVSSYGPSWLTSGLSIKHWIIGCGPQPPLANLTSPEIIVATTQSSATILGVSFSTKPCLATMSKHFIWSFTYNDMYNVGGHEIGHCLGLDHIGGDHPATDTMDSAYDYVPGTWNNPKLCHSNLNVAGLKGVFANQLGRPTSEWGATGTVANGSYARIAC